MKKFFFLFVVVLFFNTICAQTVWRLNENPVYFSTYKVIGGDDLPMTDNIVLADTIPIASNSNGPINLVISRDGPILHDFSGTTVEAVASTGFDDSIIVEDLTAEWAVGTYDDNNLEYHSSWKQALGNQDIAGVYCQEPNFVIRIAVLDLYIEYRLLSYKRKNNRGIDSQSMYFPHDNGGDQFAHLRGSPGGETNSSIVTLHDSETQIWSLDENNDNNILIVNDGLESDPNNQDNIYPGVTISRSSGGGGLYNILDPDSDIARDNTSGAFLMFNRVPIDFNIETELDLIPIWNWSYEFETEFNRAARYIDTKDFKMLIAIVLFNAENEYSVELITEVELLSWQQGEEDGFFSYIRGTGPGDTETGRGPNGFPYDDYENGVASLFELNTPSGDSGYRIKGFDANNYSSLGANAVDLSKNDTAEANGASAPYSFASGRNTIADGYNTTAIGTFNTVDEAADNTTFSLSNRAFVVGNGDSTQRSDAFTVLFDGTTTVAGELNINSDMRLKANIVSLGTTLTNLLKLDGKSYTMKRDKQQKTKIGVLAQDIQEVYPELVSEHNGLLSVNYQGLVPVLINAIKEQQKMIEKNNELIKLLLEKNKN